MQNAQAVQPKGKISLKIHKGSGNQQQSSSQKQITMKQSDKAQTLSTPVSDQNTKQKNPSIFHSLNQFGNQMSKTLGKKSIKLLSNSSFNNKAINSSNPN